MKPSFGERFFDYTSLLFLGVTGLIILLPIIHVLAGSLSSSMALAQVKVTLWPVDFNLDNYKVVTSTRVFWNAFLVTLTVVFGGTLLNMFLTMITSYPLSRDHLRGRKLLLVFIVFTMIFQAPMIPTYLVIKSLGLLNTLWALIVPMALSAFNIILCVTFFRNLPEELFDAAKVDGMSEYNIVWKIVVPISMPIIVTLILFYAVGHWNAIQAPLLYVNDAKFRTLQLYLYYIVAKNTMTDTLGDVSDMSLDFSPQGIQMATIVSATLPIVLVYPFLQRHFIKGALLGSVKG
jgi:ABC-type glycerol-3-phosphate transport system permease component